MIPLQGSGNPNKKSKKNERGKNKGQGGIQKSNIQLVGVDLEAPEIKQNEDVPQRVNNLDTPSVGGDPTTNKTSFYYNPLAEEFAYGPKARVFGETVALFLGVSLVTLVPQLVCFYSSDLLHSSDTARSEAWFMICPNTAFVLLYAIAEYFDRTSERRKLAKRRKQREGVLANDEENQLLLGDGSSATPRGERSISSAEPPDVDVTCCLSLGGGAGNLDSGSDDARNGSNDDDEDEELSEGEEYVTPNLGLLFGFSIAFSLIAFVPGFIRLEDNRAFDGGSGEGLFILVANYIWLCILVFVVFVPFLVGPYRHLKNTMFELNDFHKYDWDVLVGPKEWQIDIKQKEIGTIENIEMKVNKVVKEH
eukprot:UN25341